MTKKIVSVVLAVAMLFAVLSVNISAASTPSKVYTVTAPVIIKSTHTFSELLFQDPVVTLDTSKLTAFDGHVKDYTYEINSIVCNKVDYLVDKEAFFANFEDTEEKPFDGATIYVTFTITFESEYVFGTLDYLVEVSGFTSPLDIPIIGGLIGGDVSLMPAEDTIAEGTIHEFPRIKNITILQQPSKQDYYDTEKFDLVGTKIFVETEFATSYNEETGIYTYDDGISGEVTFDEEINGNMFTCTPTRAENLSVFSSHVATFFDGIYIGKLPVSVEHKYSSNLDGSERFVNITTNKYTDTNPGYHAVVCEGCGETHNPQFHVPAVIGYAEDGSEIYWESNGDQTFVKNGTESGVCADCGTTLTRDALHSADFNTIFADYHFLKVIFEYINVIFRFIDGGLG